MFDDNASRLFVRFILELDAIQRNHERLANAIPATHLGRVVALTNELVRSTWNYALSHPEDERFREVRRLEATGAITRRNIELAVVSVHEGSLELEFGWFTALLGIALVREVALGVGVNALWDLIKYSFQALRNLLRRHEQSLPQDDPLVNELLTPFTELARTAFTSPSDQVFVKTEFRYSDRDTEISFTIDQHAQERVLALDRVETESIMRFVGTVVGIDYSEEVVGIRFEHFPDETVWCDVSGFELGELARYLPMSPAERPRRIGVDAEVAWRRGAARVFPPSSMRIIRIVPEEELLNPFSTQPFARAPIYGMDEVLSPTEIKFLEWLQWADSRWHDPNVASISSYLEKNPNVIGKRLSRREIEHLIKKFLQYGILYRVHDTWRREPNHQTLRLNRNHPVVLKYLGRT